MPSTDFATIKNDVLNLIRGRGCKDTAYIDANTTSFEDLVLMLFEFAKTFDCDPGWLVTLLSVAEEATRVEWGAYLDATIADPDVVTNPNFIVRSSIDNVLVQNTGGNKYRPGLEITNGSHVANLVISGGVTLGVLVISGNTTVDNLEVEEGSCVDLLLLKGCDANLPTLSKYVKGSCIANIGIDPGATLGYAYCKPVDLPL